MTVIDAKVPPAYSSTDVRDLVGISIRRLDHWTRIGILKPSLGEASGTGTRRRWSARDVLMAEMCCRIADEASIGQRGYLMRLAVRAARGSQLGEGWIVIVGHSSVMVPTATAALDLVRSANGAVWVVRMGEPSG